MPCHKRMTRCRLDCGHREIVAAYRTARYAAEIAAENATAGYATELREHRETAGMITFRAYLEGSRRFESTALD